jgi:hypothetical protein
VYAQRARLLAEEQEEQTEATTPTPSVQRKNTRPSGASARAKACLDSVRLVASGSQRSLHPSTPSRVRNGWTKKALPRTLKTPKSQPPTVSSIVRHRPAS